MWFKRGQSWFSPNTLREKKTMAIPKGFAPALPGKTLMEQPDIQEKLHTLTQWVSVTETYWHSLYVETTQHFLEWCQAMPFSKQQDTNYYCPYGLFHYGMDVAITSLRASKGVLYPKGTDSETIARFNESWTFACFLAGLFYTVTIARSNREVLVLDEPMQTPMPWTMKETSLYAPHRYYKVSFINDLPLQPLEKADLLTLANNWLTPASLRWFRSFSPLYDDWVDFLTKPESPSQLANVVGRAINYQQESMMNKQTAFNSKEDSTCHVVVKNKATLKENHAAKQEKIEASVDLLLCWLVAKPQETNKKKCALQRVNEGWFIVMDRLMVVLEYEKSTWLFTRKRWRQWFLAYPGLIDVKAHAPFVAYKLSGGSQQKPTLEGFLLHATCIDAPHIPVNTSLIRIK